MMSISSRTRWPPGRSVVRRCLIFASFLLSVSIFLLAKKTDINRSDNFVLHDSPQKIVTNIDAVRAILKSVFNIGLSFPPLSGLQSIRQAYQRPNKDFLEERWYFTLSNITYYSHSLPHLQELWPRADLPLMDRIENQLLFQPTRIILVGQGNDTNGLKIIFVPNDVRSWFAEEGRGTFLKDKCPVDSCYLTNDRTMAKKSDAIIFKTASYNSKVNNTLPCTRILENYKNFPHRIPLLSLTRSTSAANRISGVSTLDFVSPGVTLKHAQFFPFLF